eukprot:jgi/Galph1/1941/GphlegSOOS_G612.1
MLQPPLLVATRTSSSTFLTLNLNTSRCFCSKYSTLVRIGSAGRYWLPYFACRLKNGRSTFRNSIQNKVAHVRCTLSKDNLSTSKDEVCVESKENTNGSNITKTAKENDSSFYRKSIMLLSFLGILDTSFLTIGKLLFSPEAMCHTEGCMEVLASPYSSLFGVPLSLFGVVAYLAIFSLSASPFFFEKESGSRSTWEILSRKVLQFLTSVMALFSGILMYILFVEIRSFCPYCVLSAFLSFSLFLITMLMRCSEKGLGKLLRRLFVVLLSSLSIFGGTVLAFGTVSLSLSNQIFDPPAITTHSDKRMLQLAEKLRSKKSRMYGAFWCEHCYHQKQMLGQEAFSKIEYIECSKNGRNSKYNFCRVKEVPGYPTWEIDGELYPGEQSIDDLEGLAGIKKHR